VTPVHVVVPDDAAVRPSGGSAYDERIIAGLAAAGRDVRTHFVPGAWPRPHAAAPAALAAEVAGVPDGSLVVVDGLIASAAPEVLVPESGRIGLVVLVHMPVPDAGRGRYAERLVLTAARAVVTTSAWSRDVLLDRHPLAPDRVHVVLPGTDPADPASASPAGGRLLCVAAVVPHKGQDLLVRALSGLPGAWDCTVVGPLDRDRAFVAKVRERVARAGLDDRVHLVGPRTGASLDRAYREADLLVHPSRLDAYGMVVPEALARGVPVVATAVGGVPEALGQAPGGPPGLLVPPDDAAALQVALGAWLRDGDLRHELRRRALHRRTTLPGWDAAAANMAAALDAADRREERLRG
jgi:glycosyltransferase involved in cell wall biosynthesis